MSTTTVMYLAVIAAAIHVLLGALQSNSLGSLLSKFSIPAPPAAAMPWLGLALGLGGGVVTGLQQGLPWKQALASALLGMFSGGASSLHLQSMLGDTRAAKAALIEATPTLPPAPPVPSETSK